MNKPASSYADAAHRRSWEIAEVIFGVPFLISLALHWLAPIPFLAGAPRFVFAAVGGVLILLGIGVITAARREFARYKQPTDPGQPTSQMIKTGIFTISRNPLYLGGALVISGLGIAFRLPWTLLLLLPALLLCHFILIAPEETYLAAKFGTEYTDYTMTVRRWLGHR